MPKYLKICLLSVCLMLTVGLLSACGSSEAEESSGTWQTFRTRGAHETIRILSGSENQELASILEQCASETKVDIEIEYKDRWISCGNCSRALKIMTRSGLRAAFGSPWEIRDIW